MTFSRPVDNAVFFDRRASERAPFRASRRGDERVRLLGAEIDLVRSEEVMVLVGDSVEAGRRALIANHDLRSLDLVRRDPVVQRFFARADLIEVGSSLVLFWARLVGKAGRGLHRGAFVDWRDHFWSLAARQGWRVFYLGGAPGAADKAVRMLTKRWPALNIASHHGHFNAAGDASIMARIEAFRPQVLLVGMPMPRQEHWIESSYEALPPCVVVTLGTALGDRGGLDRIVPGWARRIGLDWLFRMALGPVALARRYVFEPLSLLDLAYADLISARRRPAA